jgi:phage tail-like protein
MFRVEIEGIEDSYVMSCSEYVDESAVIEQREGGDKAVAEKMDGLETLTPITVIRGGVATNLDWYNWRQEVKTDGGQAVSRNVSIVQLAPNGEVKGRINLTRAWPSQYQVGPWDATADETVKEQMILQYQSAVRLAA